MVLSQQHGAAHRLSRAALRRAPLSRAVGLLAGGALLVVCTAAVVFLPAAPVVAAVLGGFAGLCFLARPDLGLLAYLGVRVVADLHAALPVGLEAVNLLQAISGLATACLAAVACLELRRVERHPALLPVGMLLVLVGLAAVRTEDLGASLPRFATLASPLLVLLVSTAAFRGADAWRRVLAVVGLGGLVPLAYSAWHLLDGQMQRYALAGIPRLMGGYAELHNHAHMMGVFAALYLFWTFAPGRFLRRAAALVVAAAAVLFLALTGVRTATLGFLTFYAVFLALERRWVLWALGLLAAVVALSASEVLQSRYEDLVLVFTDHPPGRDPLRLGSGRLGIWSTSMRVFLDQPALDLLLGAGLEGYRDMVQPFLLQIRSGGRKLAMSPHNDYLSLLYSLGPLAVLSYLGLQAHVVWTALRLRRSTPDPALAVFASYAAASTSTVLVANALSNSYVERVTPGMVYWATIGAFYAAARPAGPGLSGRR